VRFFTAWLCQLLLGAGLLVGPFADAHLDGEDVTSGPHTGNHAHQPLVADSSADAPHHAALDLFLLEITRTSAPGTLLHAFGAWSPSLDPLGRLTLDRPLGGLRAYARGYSSRAPPSPR
jgi:hypothetical protein